MGYEILLTIVVISFILYKLYEKKKNRKYVFENFVRRGNRFINATSLNGWSPSIKTNLESELKYNSPMIQFDLKKLTFFLDFENSEEREYIALTYWESHQSIAGPGWSLTYFTSYPKKLHYEFHLENPESLKEAMKLGDKFYEMKNLHPDYDYKEILNQYSDHLYDHIKTNHV